MAGKYSVLICDDEPSTRLGLRDTFPWAELDLFPLAVAADGEEALDLVFQCHPDILLTDVRMPFMDGLTMVNTLRSAGYPGQVVFISAYGEVDYLRQALAVDAVDYVLKPIAFSDLRAALVRVVARLDLASVQAEQIRRGQPLLRDQFLVSLLRTETWPQDPGAEADALGLDILPGEPVHLWVTAPDQPEEFNLILGLVRRSAGEAGGWAAPGGDGRIVAIVPVRVLASSGVGAHLDQLARTLEAECRGTFSVAYQTDVPGLEAAPEAWKRLLRTLDLRIVLGRNRVLAAADDQGPGTAGPVMDDSLDEALKSGRSDVLIDRIRQVLEDRVTSATQAAGLRALVLRLLAQLGRYALERSPQNADQFFSEETLLSLERVVTLKEALAFLAKLVAGGISSQDSLATDRGHLIVETVKDLILGQPRETLSVRWLAKEVALSHTYLCMLFKKQTGLTLGEFQTKVKIDLAKELLSDPRKKSYEICYDVGYNNPGYFSRTFKRLTSMTPTEYRNAVISAQTTSEADL